MDSVDGKTPLLSPKVYPKDGKPSEDTDKETTLTEKSASCVSMPSDTDTSRCTSVSEESSEAKSRNVSTDSEDSGEVQGILTGTPRSHDRQGVMTSTPRSEDDTTSSPDV